MLVGGRDNRGQFRDDPMREYLAVARIVDVGRVMVERGHRGDHGGDHRHGVRVVVKALEEAQELLIDHGMAGDRGLKGVQLVLARQVAVDQQLRDLEKAGLLGQLLDRVAAIQEHPGVAVDVGDLAFRACGGHESRVVSKYALVPNEVRNVERVRSDRTGQCVQLAGLAGGEILEFVFLAHAGHREYVSFEDGPEALHGRPAESSA